MLVENKKIVAQITAVFCVLSSQTLVQYGLVKRDGGIIAKSSSSLQVFGASEDELQNKNELYDNDICNKCKYTLNDGDATLTECVFKDITEVKISEFVEKEGKQYKVTKIDKNAFYCFTSLESVIILKDVPYEINLINMRLESKIKYLDDAENNGSHNQNASEESDVVQVTNTQEPRINQNTSAVQDSISF